MNDVSFGRDGRLLATASFDGRVLLWDLSAINDLRANPLKRACSLTHRGLNPDEWARFVADLPYRDSCAV